MNQSRRKALQHIKEQLEALRDELENIQNDEAEYRDNIPENLQGSERYAAAEEACDNLDYAVDDLASVIDYIDAAIES